MLRGAYDAYGLIPYWVIEHVRRREFTKLGLYATMDLLSAYYHRDNSPLVGILVPSKIKKRTFMHRPGKLPARDMIIFAQSLMTHGILGKAKVRQRHESGQPPS